MKLRKKVKKKRVVVSNEVKILTKAVDMLAREVTRLQTKFDELRGLRVFEPADVRVVTQKVKEDPQTDFEKTLAFTTRQVNEHLNSMNPKELDSIVQQALGVKPSDAGPGSPMTKYLNDNYQTLVSQEDISNMMVNVIADARKKWPVNEDRNKSLKYVDKQLKAMK